MELAETLHYARDMTLTQRETMRTSVIAFFLITIDVGAVWAQTDPYQITADEKAACTANAQQFCASAYPDEDKLLRCMKANIRSLDASCAMALKAGLKGAA